MYYYVHVTHLFHSVKYPYNLNGLCLCFLKSLTFKRGTGTLRWYV